MEGGNKIIHPEIAAYYDKLKNVISGKLFSLSRLRDIFYLMTHQLSIDPNNPEDALYFLSPKEYNQIFEEDYGVYKHLNEFDENFKFYSINGKRIEGFTSKYWSGDDLISELSDTRNNMKGISISSPNVSLRKGDYSFDIDYVSLATPGQIVGSWDASILIGEEQFYSLKKGDFMGTHGESGKISGTFTLEGLQDMAKIDIRTFAQKNRKLIIEGITLTKIN